MTTRKPLALSIAEAAVSSRARYDVSEVAPPSPRPPTPINALDSTLTPAPKPNGKRKFQSIATDASGGAAIGPGNSNDQTAIEIAATASSAATMAVTTMAAAASAAAATEDAKAGGLTNLPIEKTTPQSDPRARMDFKHSTAAGAVPRPNGGAGHAAVLGDNQRDSGNDEASQSSANKRNGSHRFNRNALSSTADPPGGRATIPDEKPTSADREYKPQAHRDDQPQSVTLGTAGGLLKSPRRSTPRTPRSPRTPRLKGAIRTPQTPRGSIQRTPRTPRHTPKTPKTPKTPRTKDGSSVPPSAAATPLPGHRFIVSIVEFRNRQMVGLAAMNLKRPELLLWQYSDNQTYTMTLLILNSYEPQEILIPDTTIQSSLCTLLRHEFDMVHTESVRRKYFNEEDGKKLIDKYGLAGSLAIVETDGSKYLCLAAAAALLKYIEHIQDINFTPNTLQIRFKSPHGRMKIDLATARNLELVHSAVSARRNAPSLFKTLNKCKTTGGAQLLRGSVLQPMNDIATIKGRLDAVEELTNREDVFFDLLRVLGMFVDVDHVCANLVNKPKKANVKSAQQAIINLLYLRQALELIPEVAAICERCECEAIKVMVKTLRQPQGETILRALSKVLDPEGGASRKRTLKQRTQLVFAVQTGINGLLDVARQTYIETTEEMHQLAQKYRDDLSAPDIRLLYTASRGHHLNVPAEVAMGHASKLFVQTSRKGRRVYCSTGELLSLNERQNEVFADICKHTERVVEQVMGVVRENIHYLYSISESLSLLDMILSFANVVSVNHGYVKPEFTTDGPIAIKEGRHPIIELLDRDYVANSTYLTSTQNMQIVTGPNNSGKSTYLRQTGVLTVMAHIGCYVPASFASFRCVDQLLTRMAVTDELESNSSTFAAEMKETTYILKNASGKSLVLIDELGRGTSTVDGVALAWAVSEELLRSKAYTLLATHFMALTELTGIYSNVRNTNLKVECEGSAMKYLFALADGPTSERDKEYGIHLAEVAALPADIIAEARRISKALRARVGHRERTSAHLSTKAYADLIMQIRGLKSSPLGLPAIRRFLAGLTKQLPQIKLPATPTKATAQREHALPTQQSQTQVPQSAQPLQPPQSQQTEGVCPAASTASEASAENSSLQPSRLPVNALHSASGSNHRALLERGTVPLPVAASAIKAPANPPAAPVTRAIFAAKSAGGGTGTGGTDSRAGIESGGVAEADELVYPPATAAEAKSQSRRPAQPVEPLARAPPRSNPATARAFVFQSSPMPMAMSVPMPPVPPTPAPVPVASSPRAVPARPRGGWNAATDVRNGSRDAAPRPPAPPLQLFDRSTALPEGLPEAGAEPKPPQQPHYLQHPQLLHHQHYQRQPQPASAPTHSHAHLPPGQAVGTPSISPSLSQLYLAAGLAPPASQD